MKTHFAPVVLAAFFVLYGNGDAQEAQNSADRSVPENQVEAAEIGSTRNVHKAGDLFFAGQFAEDDVPLIREQGISRVITLRTDGEVDWDEKLKIEAAGMEYLAIPFSDEESLNDEVFDRLRVLLSDKSKKTLLHCGSANRVGGAWLPYRVLDEGVDVETAIKEAVEIGLRTAFIKEKALDYIERNRDGSKLAASEMAGEASVKPGINKKFVSPDLNVDEYIARFEIESREVFLLREKILAACEIQAGERVADIGAGTGLFTRLFSVEVGNKGWVYAVDIAPRFIEHINRDAVKHELHNITGVLCAENSANLPPNSVDVAFICDTYHHFEYPKSTLTSIHRALKKDGRLIVIDFDRIEGKTREWLLAHVRAGKDVFRKEIQAAGFTFVAEKRIDGFKENYFMTFTKSDSSRNAP